MRMRTLMRNTFILDSSAYASNNLNERAAGHAQKELESRMEHFEIVGPTFSYTVGEFRKLV